LKLKFYAVVNISWSAMKYWSCDTSCTARFNIHQFHVLPSKCIYEFCVDLRTNSDYFPTQY